jgi:hypothetical protein
MDTWNGENYPITRFLSETGVESMPSLQTWKEATSDTEDLKFDSKLVENREHHGNGQNEMMFVFKFSYKFFMSMNILEDKSKII